VSVKTSSLVVYTKDTSLLRQLDKKKGSFNALWGHAVAQLDKAQLQTRRLWNQFPMVSLEFFIDIILPAALWPWG
jgi:hypothetical protein